MSSVDVDNDVLLLTCASGKQCSQLIPLLYGRWKHLRLAVNSESSEKRLAKEYPNATVVRADMSVAEDARRILSGVTTVLHIGPSFHQHETSIGYTMIDAAYHEAEHGVFKHFVYSSVLHPQLRKLMNHDCKRYVEEYLIESGLNYTIIQPSHLLDTIPVKLLMQQETPVYPARFDPKVTFSFTVLKDLADAFARVFEQREKHYLAEYTACSTGPISYIDVMALLSKEIGKPIKVEQTGFWESLSALQKVLYGESDIARGNRDGMQRLNLYYNFYGIKGNPNVLEWLIGRPTTNVEEFLRRKVLESKNVDR